MPISKSPGGIKRKTIKDFTNKRGMEIEGMKPRSKHPSINKEAIARRMQNKGEGVRNRGRGMSNASLSGQTNRSEKASMPIPDKVQILAQLRNRAPGNNKR